MNIELTSLIQQPNDPLLRQDVLRSHGFAKEVIYVCVHTLTRNCLQRQNDQYREPVKHIMHSGATKRPTEFVLVCGLPHGDDGVGDRCTNICSHDDIDSLVHRQN